MLHLKKNILFEIKKYVDDIDHKQPLRRYSLKKLFN
jgi:hypothetical protein